jgi:hypothetical protein
VSRTERSAQVLAVAILGLAAAGSLTVLIYAIGHIPPTRGLYVVLYDVTPTIVLLAAVAGLVARSATRLAFASCVVAAGLACYVAEATLAMREGSYLPYVPAMRTPRPPWLNGPWDARSRLAVILDLRARGVDAYPAPNRLEQMAVYRAGGAGRSLYPLGGIANVPTVFCNESGAFANYASDGHGFNNPPSAWRDGAADVVVIGDSFAHGACVDTSVTIASDIRRTYPATVTLGLAGSGPLHELATLREYATTLRPRVVVWLYFSENDFSDFEEERSDGMLARYRERTFRQGLLSRQPEIDSALRAQFDGTIARHTAAAHHPWLENAKGFLLLQHVRRHAFPLLVVHGAVPLDLPCSPDRFSQVVDVIANAQAEAATWGGKFYFVYLAEWGRADLIDHCAPRREALLRALDRRGVPVIDLEARFAVADSAQRRLWRPHADAHYTPAGYAVAAQTILDRLEADRAVLQAK